MNNSQSFEPNPAGAPPKANSPDEKPVLLGLRLVAPAMPRLKERIYAAVALHGRLVVLDCPASHGAPTQIWNLLVEPSSPLTAGDILVALEEFGSVSFRPLEAGKGDPPTDR